MWISPLSEFIGSLSRVTSSTSSAAVAIAPNKQQEVQQQKGGQEQHLADELNLSPVKDHKNPFVKRERIFI